MNNAVNVVLAENVLQRVCVTRITFIERDGALANLFDTLQRFRVTV